MIFINLYKFKIIEKRSVFTSKFVRILKTFSKEELKDFELWLKSPWANAHKVLVPLLQHLKPYYPNFKKRKLTKAELFQLIQPEGTYSLSRINNLLSKGFIAAEEFLVFQSLKKDKNLQNDLLSRELQSRHLEDWFFKNIDSEIERLDNKEVKDWEDHLDLLRLHRRVYHHPNASTRMQPGGKTIVEMGKQVDLVYLLEKAAIINEKIFRNRVLKDENHEVEKELKIWKVAAADCNDPAVELYRMRFEDKKEDLVAAHYELRESFFDVAKRMSQFDQKIHLYSLLNNYSALYKQGFVPFSECLPLYQFGLETEILLNAGIISRVTFVTTVIASNANKSFDYTEFFIEKYSKHLEPSIQSDGRVWAKAHTLYRKGEFEWCRDVLLSNDFKTYYFQRASKLLTVQSYFELFLEEENIQIYLLNYLDSFEKWIHREKLHSKLSQSMYLRFIQITRQFVKIYGGVDFHPEKLEFIKNEKNVQAIGWLKEKALEIIELKRGHPK